MLVANTFHHEQSIAEYVAAAAVMLRRDFLTQDRELRRNIWATSVYDAAIPQPRALGGAPTSASWASATSAGAR
jgi:phosphoglycerate dehydrogenase-like enzyme